MQERLLSALLALLAAPARADTQTDTLVVSVSGSSDALDAQLVARAKQWPRALLRSMTPGDGWDAAACGPFDVVARRVTVTSATVDARTHEVWVNVSLDDDGLRSGIATLRALGFQGGPVVVSVLAESLCLALVGGLAGGALAWAAANGYETATMNWQTFSQVAFSLRVTPGLLAGGLAYAVVMGLVGGLFPAVRAARLPVASGLRQR